MPLSTSAIAKLNWWFKHLRKIQNNHCKTVARYPADCTTQADTSEQEWGAIDVDTPIDDSYGFFWRKIMLIF